MSHEIYFRPAAPVDTEFKEKKSLFIAHLRIVTNEPEARTALKEIDSTHKQASHNCWAYRIGYDPVTEYYSDAGEPTGTAGKPILGAIQRVDCSDTLIVVTRYFGGIKLGVRGLIEAYGQAATSVLEKISFTKVIPSTLFSISLSYGQAHTTIHRLKSMGISDTAFHVEYGAHVQISVAVPLNTVFAVEELLSAQSAAGLLISYNRLD